MAPSSWNLLWVVIDGLKADHLGVAGYHRPITPHLDQLAAEGVHFRYGVTQSPWSLPSYASMLSSRYPFELVLTAEYLRHIRGETEVARSRDPGRMPEFNFHWFRAVPEGVPLVAEVLGKEGFICAAWVNNAWLKPGTYGLERGFSFYHDGLVGDSPYTPADETARQAREWIRAHAHERWFVFLQFMDPHRPWKRHPEFDYGPRFIDQYDSEIAFTDAALGTIVKELEALNLRRRTVIVITSDHGEGVFASDAEFVGHGGGVLPEIVLVPVILSWPRSPPGKVVDTLCRNVDLMPTVLELLEVPSVPGMAGRSLVGEIRRSSWEDSPPAFTMAVLKGPEQISVLLPGPRPTILYQGVVLPGYRRVSVFKWEEGKRTPEDAPPEVAARAIAELERFVAQIEQTLDASPPGEAPFLDEKLRANLKALGYFQ